MKPKRIGVFGLFGSGNLGNDGSLEAMLRFLRRACPDAELTCICANPVKMECETGVRYIRIDGPTGGHSAGRGRRLGRLGLPLRLLRQAGHAFTTTRRLDVLLIPGTGILDDFTEGPFGMPAALSTWCAAARLSGTRLALVSVGAGPIVRPLSRRLMKAAARMAHYRSYRDTLSKDFMDSIGFDTSADPITPDIAFSLPTPDIPATAAPPAESAPTSSDTLNVGLGVMTYYGWRGDRERDAAIYASYLGKVARFTLWLLDRGYRVRLLMGEDTDQQAIDDVQRTIATERPGYPRERLTAKPSHSLHELMRQMAETDIVVGTRFHNVVCALKLGKPMISLGYAKKNDVLMADMGLADFCQQVEQLDVDRLIKQFVSMAADRPAYERGIRMQATEYRRRLAEQEQLLLKTVLA